MPIPCFLSTCSIDLSADPLTGQLIANARLADTGSLGCVDRLDPDTTDGLFVSVAGLLDDQVGYNQFDGEGVFAPAAPPCGQSLARAADGSLFAYPEGMLTQAFPGSGPNLIPLGPGGNAANNAVDTDDYSETRSIDVTNPFDCPAWCEFWVHEMKVAGQRPDPATAENFYAVLLGQLDVPGDLVTTNVLRKDIFGTWSGAGGGAATALQNAWSQVALFPLNGGQTKTVDMTITVLNKLRFDMSGGGAVGGVSFLHPVARFWRDEPPRPGV